MSFRLDQPLNTGEKYKVLVTGADGMLGNNIVRELLSRGHSVCSLIDEVVMASPLKDCR